MHHLLVKIFNKYVQFLFKKMCFLAPRGCLQYYPNATGTVSTFNFDSPNVDMRQYLPNLNYAICFNRPNDEVIK